MDSTGYALAGLLRSDSGGLDHVIVLTEASLRRTIRSYLVYHHGSRTHFSLAKDTPERRTVQPPELGRVFAIPHLGGLHHRYERRAA